MQNKPSLLDLETRFKVRLVGDSNQIISGLSPLASAGEGQLAFLVNPLYRQQAIDSHASAIIVSERDFEFISQALNSDIGRRNFLVAKNPYASFARIAQYFAQIASPPLTPGIHPSAVIEPSAIVPSSCHIGPFCYVGSGVVLGERVVLLGHVNLGENAKVGADSRIYPSTTIYKHCEVGERSILHSGVVLGADGFGFAPDFSATGGEWVKIPQTGRVIVGHDVEIGANTTVDRGAMTDTVIEDGCKIDNLVQIAHNVRIGAHTVIAACTAVAGSTTIGKFCVIGGSANFVGHITVADRTTISGGTSITKTIKEPGQHFTSLFPALPHADWEKNAAIVRGLDKMRQRVRTLEQSQHIQNKTQESK